MRSRRSSAAPRSLQADLTREDEVARLFADARAALGTVDVCVQVQGVWPREDVPVWELSLERWEETLRSNLTTTFLVARAFLREVAEKRPRLARPRRARPRGSSARPGTRTTRRRSRRSRAGFSSP